jgi:hypothetical protein
MMPLSAVARLAPAVKVNANKADTANDFFGSFSI